MYYIYSYLGEPRGGTLKIEGYQLPGSAIYALRAESSPALRGMRVSWQSQGSALPIQHFICPPGPLRGTSAHNFCPGGWSFKQLPSVFSVPPKGQYMPYSAKPNGAYIAPLDWCKAPTSIYAPPLRGVALFGKAEWGLYCPFEHMHI